MSSMLSRLIETVLIHAVNTARQRRQARVAATASGGERPTGEGVIGHVLPSPSGPPAAPAPLCLSDEALRRHVYALGSSGSGKTSLLLNLIDADLARGRGLCVLDLRGDLVDRVLLRLARREDPAAQGRRVLLLDLRDAERVVAFNPLASEPGAPEEDRYQRALHLLGILRQQSDSWGVQLDETLRNCLLALSEAGWSLLEVEPLLTRPAFRAEVMANVSDPAVRAFFARYGALAEDQQAQWRLPVLNKFSAFLALPSLRRMLGQRRSSFSLRGILDEPGTVLLVSLAVDRLQQGALLAGALIASALENAFLARADVPESQRTPVSVYLDEFQNFAGPQFAALLSEGRRFGCSLVLAHQSLGQLPGPLWQAIRTNANHQFLFGMGAGDAAELAKDVALDETREEVRKLLMGQSPGEAVLVRRGQPSARVRLSPSPDPAVDQAGVRSVREAAWAAYAVGRGGRGAAPARGVAGQAGGAARPGGP